MSIAATIIETLYEEILEEHVHCINCKWLYRGVERHPYGDGFTEEHLEECQVPTCQECPQVETILEQALAKCRKQSTVLIAIPITSKSSQAKLSGNVSTAAGHSN